MAAIDSGFTMVDVDHHGDVIFICNGREICPAGETVRVKPFKCRVSSTVLKAASPVFKAMLEPILRGRQRLESASIVEIPLLKDDPAAVLILMDVLHGRTIVISKELETRGMIDLCSLADRYKCTKALKEAARPWVILKKASECPEILGRVLITCFLLNMTSPMEEISCKIILNSTANTKIANADTVYGIEHNGWIMDNLDEIQLCKDGKHFEQLKRDIKCRLDNFLRVRELSPNVTCSSNCHVAELATYELLNILRENSADLPALEHAKLGDIANGLKQVPAFPFSPRYDPCSLTCAYWELRKYQRGHLAISKVGKSYIDRIHGAIRGGTLRSENGKCMYLH